MDGWTAGDFIKITTKAGTTSDRNGLAEPVLADTDGNGTVDRAYAGDLKGNLWAFDLSSTSASNWNVAFKSGSTPIPLFKTGTNQPITAKPVLTKHPTIPFSSSPSNAPNFMVFFGTGQYLVNSDKTDTSTQSYYGVWDKGDATIDQTDLIEQTMTTFTSGEKTYRNITNNFVDYSTDYGWWFNLSTSGERNVTNSIARSNTVFFNSFVPENDPCAVGGYGFEYAVNMATGGSPSEPVVDYNGDGVVNEDDNIGGHVNAAVKTNGYLPQPVFVEDLKFSGATTARKVIPLTDLPSGRFSWQELIK
jgi:type IV pilus assembly protein PilY1